ncbi:GNAT family N-acetyltransferase [Saccharothrix sp. ALI-22-I]|uniref:GNAT family N-acetyltransferase n=1 Tax=Saccharothrix sp. ALI-22-I TaxID=1933778 RepID=UPI0015C2DB8E|nr:GNAT family N-acetyltransferase [Saccharothrix sp. ALI-22-I]
MREDVAALVRLRLANAERHIQLDPAVYRLPDADVVRRHFEDVLSGGSDVLIFVAEVDGGIAGMAELVPLPDPPEHQIAVPRRAADVHTVVLDGYRGRGVGKALLREAERAASERGVSTIYAGILTLNQNAVRFYASAGFGPRGTMLRKELGKPAPD